MVEEHKESNRRIRALEEVVAEVEAEKLLAAATDGVVTQVFEGRDAESLKKLAHALIVNGIIALLGSRDKDTARLVFARSADAVGDMNALMREARDARRSRRRQARHGTRRRQEHRETSGRPHARLDTTEPCFLIWHSAWGSSSVWQSAAFAMRRSGVRSPSAPPLVSIIYSQRRRWLFWPTGQNDQLFRNLV